MCRRKAGALQQGRRGMAARDHLPFAHCVRGRLLTVACALEEEAARRYRDLARWAADENMGELAHFRRSRPDGGGATGVESRPVAISARSGRSTLPSCAGTSLKASTRGGLIGRARPVAIGFWLGRSTLPACAGAPCRVRRRGNAVGPADLLPGACHRRAQNKERAFAFYTYVAAEAGSPGIRALAEDSARDELEHAAFLRRERRRAFRDERPSPLAIPGDVASLRSASVAWEREEEATQEMAGADRVLERNFERYMEIAERAKDETVVAEAQRLADAALRRLAFAHGSRGNPLIGSRP